MFRFFALVFVSVLTASALPMKIACVGDSITEGGNLANPAVESYPARLQKLLGTNNFTVRNFGVSGRTLLKQGDFPYWTDPAFAASKNFAPDIVIIQLGTNDGKPYNWKYGTNFVANYKELIAIYQALPSAPRVFLCSPCPVFGAGSFNIDPGTVRTNIAPTVRGLAAELSLPLIDLQARMTNAVWFPDTVHPDTKGMMAMTAVMHEGLFPTGSEVPPTLEFRRLSASSVVLSWPQRWGSFYPQYATLLKDTNMIWIMIESTPPIGDGTTIRQTNVAGGPLRIYQLRRP